MTYGASAARWPMDVAFRFRCAVCGAVYETTHERLNMNDGILEPDAPPGWRLIWSAWICDKHTVDGQWVIDGRRGQFGTDESLRPTWRPEKEAV